MVIYVDSGSTDGSVAMARDLGAEIVELDLSKPFTAARARNAGTEKLMSRMPTLPFIQFVDGDCEVEKNWLRDARKQLLGHPQAAAVFGRRRERFPERSIYNRLVDEEWNVTPGKVKYCGGDVMMRSTALLEAGGYRCTLIAGEEPELCVRLRQRGWSILCVAEPMTVHDAAMTTFKQWWLRAMRAGHAFAEGAYLHGGPPERHWVRETRSAWIWAAAIPLMILVGGAVLGPVAFLFALVFPVQVLRLSLKRRLWSRAPISGAVLLVTGKFAELAGQIWFGWNMLRGKSGRLIEYK